METQTFFNENIKKYIPKEIEFTLNDSPKNVSNWNLKINAALTDKSEKNYVNLSIKSKKEIKNNKAQYKKGSSQKKSISKDNKIEYKAYLIKQKNF